MSPIALLLNLLWLLFGGLWAAIGWGIAAVIMAITIIGIPWAKAAFNIGTTDAGRLPGGRPNQAQVVIGRILFPR